MYTLIIYYNVEDGGDGSANVKFFESKKLAQWVHDQDIEPFGDNVPVSITFQSEKPISLIDKEIRTKEDVFVKFFFNQYGPSTQNLKSEFVSQFFPKGPPVFTVKTETPKGRKKYLFNYVYVENVQVATDFRMKNHSGKVFEDLLNS